ncbi:MAG: hypothetical protein AAF487_15040 [Bacteroidota bacterium]
MNIKKLIERTNEKEFYKNWNLRLKSLNGEIDHLNNYLDLSIILEKDITEDQIKIELENWTIRAIQVIENNKIFSPIYMPYIKLAILDDHPLLWRYKYDELECELKGHVKNINKLAGELHWLYQKHTGGFIKWERDFSGIKLLANKADSISISINLKTFNFVKELIEDYKLILEIQNVLSGVEKGFTNRPEAKVLMLGNRDVNPHEFNLRQPYIIADDFRVTSISNSK